MFRSGLREETASPLEGANIGCLGALGAHAALEGDALVFGEALEAGGLNVLEVREEVVTALVRLDEAKALGVIEPFYGAGQCSHEISYRCEMKGMRPRSTRNQEIRPKGIRQEWLLGEEQDGNETSKDDDLIQVRAATIQANRRNA